jgi:hypothetical protein
MGTAKEGQVSSCFLLQCLIIFILRDAPLFQGVLGMRLGKVLRHMKAPSVMKHCELFTPVH